MTPDRKTNNETWWTRVVASEVSLCRSLRQYKAIIMPFALFIHYCCREVGFLIAVVGFLFAGQWQWGVQTFFLLCCGELVNGSLKFATQEPRPMWRESSLIGSEKTKTWEKDYSLPSSHAQVTLGFGLAVASALGFDRPMAIVVLAIAVAAALTRVFLAQHYLHDVLAGWVVELILFSAVTACFRITTDPSRVWERVGIAFFLLFNVPLIIHAIKVLVPERPAEQIAKWQEHARQVSGRLDGVIVGRPFEPYRAHAVVCFTVILSYALVYHFNLQSTFFSTCSSLSFSQWITVTAVRLGLGAPVLLMGTLLGARPGIEYAFVVALSSLWGLFGVFLFVDKVIGLHC